MKITKRNFNFFIFFKLPAAWWCGVRVNKITEQQCIVYVTHRWINQNPFKSMYFAVQAMAAELSTGALVMKAIKKQKESISMLVAQNNAHFTKKATGKIKFTCVEGEKIMKKITEAIETRKGTTFWLKSEGINEQGIVVSNFNFEWTIKIKD